MNVDQEIQDKKLQIAELRDEIERLEYHKKLQQRLPPKDELAAKLRDIYRDAAIAEDGGDFIRGIVEDKELKQWFGPIRGFPQGTDQCGDPY